MERPVVPPQIRELVISHPSHPYNIERYMTAIVELMRSQHVLGIPFKHMIVCMEMLPMVMVERLRSWVGVVECHKEVRPDNNY